MNPNDSATAGADFQRAWQIYGPGVAAKLKLERATDHSDEELQRCLGGCAAGNMLVRLAKEARALRILPGLVAPLPVRPYVMFAGPFATVVDIPVAATSGDWALIQQAFAKQVYPKHDPQEVWVTCHALYPDQRLGSVYWAETLWSADGMAYFLIPLPGSREAQVTQLRRKIKREQDVAYLKVFRPARWIDDFKLPELPHLPYSPPVKTWGDASHAR